MWRAAGRRVARKGASVSVKRVAQPPQINGPVQIMPQVRTIYASMYGLAKKVMPPISATERAALECGTVGFDRELFSGNPKLSSLNKYTVDLNEREKAFMAKEVEELCEMLNDYQIQLDQDLPPHVWQYIKDKKFLGMIIPESHGGLGFTPHGHSMIVQKIGTRSLAAAVTVMVPNSLGPGELLMKYGTEAQKQHYLPRLAKGVDIPCFALTSPQAGSDAASMPDRGVVCMRNGKLGVSLTFDKRYITLAPVATVVGLAFNLVDPDGLLQGKGAEGISLALLPRGYPGLETGPRHDVLSIAFMNGTVKGADVFIPMDMLIGGQERAGSGWRMLMECLAEGRGISLPALSTGGAKLATHSVGAYSRVRKQFKVPIAELEGVQERLANIAQNTYTMVASQHLMNAMLNKHEQPSVLSAVMKQQMTDKGRICINEAMDIIGGAGICKGPMNTGAATGYQGMPIGITVEGSNTLTRSLIIFGQGLVRSHPHILDMMNSVRSGDDLKGFTKHISLLVSHGTTNAGRSLSRAVTRKRFVGGDRVAYYESQLGRLASNFALCSDLALTLGGRLKFAEMVSGRMADVLSNLFMGYANLWYFKTHYRFGSEALLDLAMANILYDTQESLLGVARNFPVRPVGWAMKALTFPAGRSYAPPTDAMIRDASNAITTVTEVRDLMTSGIFISKDPADRVRELETALPLAIQADSILKQARKEKRDLSPNERKIVDSAEALRNRIIQVDSFKALGRAYWEEVFAKDNIEADSRRNDRQAAAM